MGKCIIITGSGRSGTTWIHDLLTSHYSYRRIFEPLHPRQVASAAGFAGLFLQRDSQSKELNTYLDKVFYRRTDDAWLRWLHCGITRETKQPRRFLQYAYNLPKFKFWAKNRVVKFIQANLMIEWLHANFEHAILFVIRNPYHVVRSQRNMGWANDIHLYLNQPELVSNHLDAKTATFVAGLDSMVERLCAIWCIQNKVAIEQTARITDRVHCVSYETLRDDKRVRADAIRSLGYTDREVGVLEQTYRLKSKLRSGYRRSTARAELSAQETDRMAVVLERFGMADYKQLVTEIETR